ncbi:MAG TPA: hypothetical protein VIK29_00740, partial [Paludibacter sp.]
MAETKRKLPEGKLVQDFIICDNTVNRYGWRLLIEGIDMEGFLKNPICCLQHSTYMAPVGKWFNLRIEGGQLKGSVEFDRNDEDAVKLYWKYADGFMSAVSLQIIPKEESDDVKQLLPGQTSSTITKSELLEVSLVTLPGNKNAVKLCTPDGKAYKLNLISKTPTMEKVEKTVEQLQLELAASKKLNAENLVLRHKERGVLQDGEIEGLKELALINYDTVSKMLDARVKSEAPAKEDDTAVAKADALVALHFSRGAISEPEKAIFKTGATLDYEGTKKVLEAKKGTDGLQTFVQGMGTGNNGGQSTDERAKWTYLDYYKKDQEALSLMAKNEP